MTLNYIVFLMIEKEFVFHDRIDLSFLLVL